MISSFNFSYVYYIILISKYLHCIEQLFYQMRRIQLY